MNIAACRAPATRPAGRRPSRPCTLGEQRDHEAVSGAAPVARRAGAYVFGTGRLRRRWREPYGVLVIGLAEPSARKETSWLTVECPRSVTWHLS